MLKLYVCPRCRETRYVSLENTMCYHCGHAMTLAPLPYANFIRLNSRERKEYIDDFASKFFPPNESPANFERLAEHALRIVESSSRKVVPLYEQEPTSKKHLEDIVQLSTLRLFHR